MPPPLLASAGNVLFASLIVGLAVAPALALRNYGGLRQQRLPVMPEPVAQVAIGPERGAAPARHTAGLTSDASSSDDSAGVTQWQELPSGPVKQWGAQASGGSSPSTAAAAVAPQAIEQPKGAKEAEKSPDGSISSSQDTAHMAAPSSADESGTHQQSAAELAVERGSESDAREAGAGQQQPSSAQEQQQEQPKSASEPSPPQQQQTQVPQQQQQQLGSATADVPTAASEPAPQQKYPIRTPQGAAALERLRALQQRRQQLYERLEARQEAREQLYQQAEGAGQPGGTGGADSQRQGPLASQQGQQQAAGLGTAGAEAAQARPQSESQQQEQRAGAAAALEKEAREEGPGSLNWLLRELEQAEEKEAAALASAAPAVSVAPTAMTSAALRQRAAAAHQAAAAAARHARAAAAAFSNAADAATTAASSAQQAAAAAARAQVAAEHRAGLEVEQAAALAAQAAAESGAAAQQAAVASAQSVLSQHSARKQAQQAVAGAGPLDAPAAIIAADADAAEGARSRVGRRSRLRLTAELTATPRSSRPLDLKLMLTWHMPL